jgi:hypothetical protein
MRDAIIASYTAAESQTPADFTTRYEALVAQYENEAN